MGTTILKQIQDTRLQESCLLLENTRMSVEDIALHVGYEDTSYFIELFKKKYKRHLYNIEMILISFISPYYMV